MIPEPFLAHLAFLMQFIFYLLVICQWLCYCVYHPDFFIDFLHIAKQCFHTVQPSIRDGSFIPRSSIHMTLMQFEIGTCVRIHTF